MFEQGNEDVFDLRAIDVGEVRKIKIGHDGSVNVTGGLHEMKTMGNWSVNY